MKTLKQKFGNNLRILREYEGLTQQQLASKAGISVGFLSSVERGKSAPSFENIEKLADALKVSVKTFFYFDLGW